MSATPTAMDARSIALTWELVAAPGACVELRAIAPTGEIASGYFDSFEAFAAAAAGINGKAQIYATVNPVPRDLLARGANIMRGDWRACKLGLAQQPVGKLTTTADTDIREERVFLADVDPVRPADIAATEEEMAAARQVAEAVQADFAARGVPSVIAASGNGYYVLVRPTPQPMTAARASARAALLRHLSARFSTERAHVDVKVGNPARIMKVLGTLSIKGAHSPDLGRPHRLSQFLSELPAEADLHAAYAAELAATSAAPAHVAATATLAPSTPALAATVDLAERARRYLATLPPAVSGQGGHDTTFRAAMVLVEGFCLDEQAALPLLQEYSARCEPPWSEKDLRHKLAEARKKSQPCRAGHLVREALAPPGTAASASAPPTPAAANGGEAPLPPPAPPEPWADPKSLGRLDVTVPPWPWEALPAVLRAMGQAIARTVNVVAEMAGAMVIGVASIALANRVLVRLKDDHVQYGNVYFMISAHPASGKTPAMRQAQAPLVACQRALTAEFREALAGHRARSRVIKAKLRALERELESGKPKRSPQQIEAEIQQLERELADAPKERCLFTNDSTSEAVAERMAANNQAMGLLASEGRKQTDIHGGRYRDGGDFDLCLAGHGGDYLRIDRKGRDPIELSSPCLSALLAIQPDALAALGAVPALRESGYLARWLFIVTQFTPSDYPTASIPAPVREVYEQAITALVNLSMGRSADGSLVPNVVVFAPEAMDAWVAFHNGLKREMAAAQDSLSPLMQQWLGKLPETVARLALIFHAVRHVSEGASLGTITTEVQDAIMLAGCLRGHAQRAFGIVGGDAVAAQARRVWRWCQQRRADLRQWRADEGLIAIDAVKPRDLVRHEVAGIENTEAAEIVLDRLADRGWMQRLDYRAPRAKPQTLYFLHPAAAGSAGKEATP